MQRQRVARRSYASSDRFRMHHARLSPANKPPTSTYVLYVLCRTRCIYAPAVHLTAYASEVVHGDPEGQEGRVELAQSEHGETPSQDGSQDHGSRQGHEVEGDGEGRSGEEGRCEADRSQDDRASQDRGSTGPQDDRSSDRRAQVGSSQDDRSQDDRAQAGRSQAGRSQGRSAPPHRRSQERRTPARRSSTPHDAARRSRQVGLLTSASR
jgi:hypothetical protein